MAAAPCSRGGLLGSREGSLTGSPAAWRDAQPGAVYKAEMNHRDTQTQRRKPQREEQKRARKKRIDNRPEQDRSPRTGLPRGSVAFPCLLCVSVPLWFNNVLVAAP